MYRRYEDPAALEGKLEAARAALRDAKRRGDEVGQMCLAEEINDLKQRIAAAWADDEAEVYGYE